jgi:hypothetical protein
MAESRNYQITFGRNRPIEFQQNPYNYLWDTLKIPFMPLSTVGLVMDQHD